MGRPYIGFKSPTHEGFVYDCGYSIRYNTVTVSIYTTNGEKAKDYMQNFISNNNVLSQLPNLKQRPGAKQDGKWIWLATDTLDKTDEELVNWFVDTILKFYSIFENIEGQ